MAGFLIGAVCFVVGGLFGAVAMAAWMFWVDSQRVVPRETPKVDDFPLLKPVYRTDAEIAAHERGRITRSS